MALVLEKFKTLTGNIAYISMSKYIIYNASTVYYALGYNSEHQEADFLALWKKRKAKRLIFKRFERCYRYE
jgi:hypothetical protein